MPGIPDRADRASASASTAYTRAGLAGIVTCCLMLIVVSLLIESFRPDGLDQVDTGAEENLTVPWRLGRMPHSYDSFQ